MVLLRFICSFANNYSILFIFMAILYTIKCPQCGEQFSVPKGVIRSWDFSQPIPEEYRDETPFHCPNCDYIMSVMDEDFNNHVLDRLYAD